MIFLLNLKKVFPANAFTLVSYRKALPTVIRFLLVESALVEIYKEIKILNSIEDLRYLIVL